MAGNYGSQNSDGEEFDLTEQQQAAIDQIREILDTLPPERRRVFQEYLKDLTDGEKGSKEKGNNEEAKSWDTTIDAASDASSD